MNTHTDKTRKNESQAVANQAHQQTSGRESAFQFVDNRPESIAQRKLQDMMKNDLPLNSNIPIQREVKRSPVPWGPTAGKWITTLQPTVPYETQDDAQAAEDKILLMREIRSDASDTGFSNWAKPIPTMTSHIDDMTLRDAGLSGGNLPTTQSELIERVMLERSNFQPHPGGRMILRLGRFRTQRENGEWTDGRLWTIILGALGDIIHYGPQSG